MLCSTIKGSMYHSRLAQPSLPFAKMASTNSVNSLFISFLLSLFLTLAFSDDPDCVYTAYVRTGSIIKAGTDSTVNLRLYDAYGYGIEIRNLEAWGGLMGPGYNYFERGNLDIFSGRGPCLRSSICALNLTSDGSGPNHGWYVNYVEVTSTGAHVPCNQQLFTIEQWLATDTSPYELTAVRNYCNSDIEGAEKRGRTEHRMIRSRSIGLVSTV